jgi:hypothetical protein
LFMQPGLFLCARCASAIWSGPAAIE